MGSEETLTEASRGDYKSYNLGLDADCCRQGPGPVRLHRGRQGASEKQVSGAGTVADELQSGYSSPYKSRNEGPHSAPRDGLASHAPCPGGGAHPCPAGSNAGGCMGYRGLQAFIVGRSLGRNGSKRPLGRNFCPWRERVAAAAQLVSRRGTLQHCATRFAERCPPGAYESPCEVVVLDSWCLSQSRLLCNKTAVDTSADGFRRPATWVQSGWHRTTLTVHRTPPFAQAHPSETFEHVCLQTTRIQIQLSFGGGGGCPGFSALSSRNIGR